MSVDFGACISYGFERLKANPAFMILGYIALILGSNVSMGLLAGPLLVGFMRGLMKEDQGRPAEIGDLFSGFSDFVPALIVALLGGLAITIGSFCIVGGILVAPMFWIGLYLVAAGEKDGIAALKKGWEITTGNMVTLAIAVLVITIVGILGAVACGVGIFATAPIALGAFYKMAQQATGGGSAAPKMAMGGAPGMPPMGR